MTKLVKFLTSLAVLALLITGLYWLGANTNWFRDDPKTWGTKSISESVEVVNNLDGTIKTFSIEDGFIKVGKEKYNDVIINDVIVNFDKTNFNSFENELNEIDYMFAYAVATGGNIPEFKEITALNNRYTWVAFAIDTLAKLDNWTFTLKAELFSEANNEKERITQDINFVAKNYWSNAV